MAAIDTCQKAKCQIFATNQSIVMILVSKIGYQMMLVRLVIVRRQLEFFVS